MITVPEVEARIGTPTVGASNRQHLQDVVDGVNAYLTRVRPDVTVWDGDFRLGALMLAERWYKRKGGEEVAVYGDYGPFPIIDTDLSQMLGLGRFSGPVIA